MPELRATVPHVARARRCLGAGDRHRYRWAALGHLEPEPPVVEFDTMAAGQWRLVGCQMGRVGWPRTLRCVRCVLRFLRPGNKKGRYLRLIG